MSDISLLTSQFHVLLLFICHRPSHYLKEEYLLTWVLEKIILPISTLFFLIIILLITFSLSSKLNYRHNPSQYLFH